MVNGAHIQFPERAVQIPVEVDRYYRDGLWALVSSDGGWRAKWYIESALRNGPSRGGYTESAKYFGKEFDLVLKLTVPIVEACEVSLPQFGQWLAKTGFGNDKNMIKGFAYWAEHKNGQGRVMAQMIDEKIKPQ